MNKLLKQRIILTMVVLTTVAATITTNEYFKAYGGQEEGRYVNIISDQLANMATMEAIKGASNMNQIGSIIDLCTISAFDANQLTKCYNFTKMLNDAIEPVIAQHNPFNKP